MVRQLLTYRLFLLRRRARRLMEKGYRLMRKGDQVESKLARRKR
ncbi:hypothetical protein CGLAMM_02620 [Acetobacteraceae bacterium EV16G]|uniref:Uncharacterized protein n=1 Tax=Sorlinia euscelidii TaxID=3081148 RepID=A0ABU7U3N2_9PROT